MIVCSILLAFGIDATWDSYRGGLARQEILSAIRADMEANATEIMRVTESHAKKEQYLDVFMRGSPASLTALSVDSAAEIVRGLPLAATFTAFAGSLTAVNLSLIDGVPLRNHLGTWLGQAADVAENAPFLIASYLSLLEIASPAGAMRIDAEESGWAADQVPANVVLGRLRTDMAYVDALLRFRAVRSVDSRKLLRLQATTDSLLAALPRRE